MKNNLKFQVPFICIAEKVRSLLGKISVHKYVQLLLLLMLFQFVGIHFASAQLSSKHYLPPLKQTTNVVQGQAIYLSTPETTAFDVNVYQGTSTTAIATLSVSNSSPGIYTPPLGTGGSTAGGDNNTTLVTGANAGVVLSSAGFRFESPSGKRFYVNWRSAQGGQASSLVSAGIAGLGTDFRWGGIPQIITSGESGYTGANSVIGIMATEDNTTVTISGYNPACTFTKNSNISGVNSITDDIINITLNAGQSYVLEAVTVYNTANIDGWLGATISSNKNIAVNQGHLMFKLQSGGIDFSMTQLTPTTNIGKEYLAIRANGVDDVEFPVIIATQNNTEVFLNNETTPYATLNNGQWVKIPATKYSQSSTIGNIAGANMYIRASKDVYAIQAMSAGPSGALIDMFQLAPLNCFLDNGINNIPDVIKTGLTGTDLTSSGIFVLASSAINESNITIKYGTGSINTVPTSTLTSAKKSVSGTTEWVSYYIPSLTGDIKVNATGPVAVGYFGVSGVAGVAAYFSGFGTIPSIDVQSTGNGCFPNTTLTATPGFTTYKWFKDGVEMTSVTSNSFTPTVAGDYYVEVYNGFCSYPSATKTVFDCNPEVVVRNTASKKYLLPGETTTFTITVKMLGGSAAQNMQISNVLPAHLTYTSSTVTNGTFTGSGSNYTWNIGTMTNGEENILRVVATAQAVTSAYAETYTVNNTQTFGLGTETNVLADDKTEDVVIYPSCSNTLAGTIAGTASYCSTTNTTTLTASNAFGDLQWQSSTDNTNFTDIGSATTSTLLITNLASTTYYRMKATVDACIAYSSSASITVTQGPTGTLSSASGTDAQSICQNTAITTISYATTNASGATFSGLPAGVTGSYSSNVVTISGTSTGTGTFNYTVILAGSCNVNLTGSIVVSNTNNTISLTSATGTNTQTACVNAAITTVSYATTGASGASFSGLPSGVTGAWSNNVVTLTGTPTVAGSYSYTINLLGGCGTVSATGSFTVIQNSIALTSASGTDAQTICTNSAMTNLTYSTTGATGASFSGLPTGVTGSWNSNSITISGTPTSTGNASFTITLTGGCGTVTATGSLTVNASPAVPVLTVLGDGCINKTTLSTPAGLTSYAWYKDNAPISGAISNTYSPTTASDYKVQVTSGSCSTMSAATTIAVCGVTADGRMRAITSPTTLVSHEGGVNFGTGVSELGTTVNATGISTTLGTIGATTAVVGGVISSTNARTTSIGVIYSTDSNFGTYSTSSTQSNVAAGTHAITLTSLSSLTNYYAKAFITNKAGTSYGAVVSFTTTSPPKAVGDVYQGGIIFYVLQSGDSGYDANVQHGLIAPFNSISRQSTNPLPPIIESQIGKFAATISGAQADGLLVGKTNTDAIILNQGSTGTYAALYCRNYANPTSKTFNSVTYTFPVYTDWYMPSIAEINKFRAYVWGTHLSRGLYTNYGNNVIYYNGTSGNGNDYAWGKYLSSTMTGQNYKLYYLESGNQDGSTAYNGWSENDRLVVMPIRSF